MHPKNLKIQTLIKSLTVVGAGITPILFGVFGSSSAPPPVPILPIILTAGDFILEGGTYQPLAYADYSSFGGSDVVPPAALPASNFIAASCGLLASPQSVATAVTNICALGNAPILLGNNALIL